MGAGDWGACVCGDWVESGTFARLNSIRLSLLPKELISSLEGLPGFDAAAFEAVHESGRQVVSIRVNPGKVGEGGVEGNGAAALGFEGAVRVPWSNWGYYLPERPSFTMDPRFHAGAYYVQEASSMFLEVALRQAVDLSRPLRVLDLCAAPGGKSTLIESLLSRDSMLVSNEVIRNRVHILQENMTKWGAAGTFITSNDPKDFQRLENYFDVIVVDAPCSGSGLFRREPEAIGEWSLDNVRLCEQRQQRILADCWPALRQDGILIYSTCSYSKQEDEDILDWMMGDLQAEGLRLNVPEEWGIVETRGEKGGYGYRCYPHRLDGEGFFLACLRKVDGGTFTAPRKKSAPERLTRQEEERVRAMIRPDVEVSFFRHQEQINVLPESLLGELSLLQSACYLKRAGVPMGKLSAKELIPEHDLAVSTVISSALPVLNVSREQALQYLRKEEIAPGDAPLGWTLVVYEGWKLGWIKVLPRRSNNYYPKEWRILKR
ncbi:MAG: RNA methyltransferase [Bacteroidetes bacterium]|nr:RNA methyltransferase [Bacteroidota bacterium]